MSDDETDFRKLAVKIGAGFVATFVVFVAVFFVVGIEDVIQQFVDADRRMMPLLLITGAGWVLAWSITLKTVLTALDHRVSIFSAALMYNSAIFANNITPFGQAGGEPITAAIFSNKLNTKYERGLAAIASVDIINFFPSIVFAILGFGYFATQITFNGQMEIALFVLAGLAILVISGLFFGWRQRTWFEDTAMPTVARGLQRIEFLIPFVDPPTEEEMRSRANSFITAIEDISHDDSSLLKALFFSALGWGFQMLTFWLAFLALNTPVPFSVPLFVIPVAATASAAPLPGGTGGIETVMIALVTSTTPVGLAAATAGVLLFRGVIYWLPTFSGSFAATAISIRNR